MPEYAVPTPKRRRGRPQGGESDAQERIIAAAVDEFGELGYDGATMRGIAARAGVDSALVHHYFGTKADLFAETVGAPMRPDLDIPALLDGPQDGLGERIVRYVLEAWEHPETRKRGVHAAARGHRQSARDPAAVGVPAARADRPHRGADRHPGCRASARRWSRARSPGILIARYVLQLPALAGASVDELVARVGRPCSAI